MSDFEPDLNQLPNEPEGEPNNRLTEDDLRDLRYKARQVDKLQTKLSASEARAADLERRVAFTEAGLTLTDKQRAALLAAHGDAEMTREALRATAAELKFIQADEPEEAVREREEALAGAARIGEAQKGAPPPAPAAPVKERIAQAEADGDFETASLLKAQQVAQLLYAGQTVQIS